MALLGLQRRLTEVGRIRLGERKPGRGGRAHPVKLTTFRLTSPDRTRIEAAAEIYGGTVEPWDDQWQVVTASDVLDIAVLPGHSLSQWWELWGRAAGATRITCLRRCDGVTEHLTDSPCRCPAEYDERREQAAAGDACRPTTRLSVLLRRVPGIGVWRLETHGVYAAVELAGTAALLETLTAQRAAPVPARLRLDRRTSPSPDGRTTYAFVVPIIDVDVALDELVAVTGPTGGVAAIDLDQAALTRPAAQVPDTRPEITAAMKAVEAPREPRARRIPPLGPQIGVPEPDEPGSVGSEPPAAVPAGGARAAGPQSGVPDEPGSLDESPAGAVPAGGAGAAAAAPTPAAAAPGVSDDEPPPPTDEDAPPRRLSAAQQLAARCRELGMDDPTRRRFVLAFTNGRTSSVRDITDEERGPFLEMVERWVRGSVVLADRDGVPVLSDPKRGFARPVTYDRDYWLRLGEQAGMTRAQVMRLAHEIGRALDPPVSVTDLDSVPGEVAEPLRERLGATIGEADT